MISKVNGSSSWRAVPVSIVVNSSPGDLDVLVRVARGRLSGIHHDRRVRAPDDGGALDPVPGRQLGEVEALRVEELASPAEVGPPRFHEGGRRIRLPRRLA